MIINANALSLPIADACVQCVVTSPPYWALRDYGVAGQLGLESTPEEYVANMVRVFREVRRVLRPDGVLFLNLGDSYAASQRAAGASLKSTLATRPTSEKTTALRNTAAWKTSMAGLKEKDLVGIPWRVAFALQADGWYLRQDIIWHKPNPMPESVRDRCTKAHEYVFLLTKSARYFWDAEGVKEKASTDPHAAGYISGDSYAVGPMSRGGHSQREGDQSRVWAAAGGRNPRSVWTVTTRPYKGAHFATFPLALAEKCILAGSRPGDVVLDPFAGAGTVGVACKKHGRKHIGTELNPEYIRLAVERIANWTPTKPKVKRERKREEQWSLFVA